MRPTPPFLVVREGWSFCVETILPEECSATVQAFRAGCYRNAWCYDSTGSKWPILEATLKQRPSFVHRVLPWKRVAVELRLGPRTEVDLGAVVSQLAVVLVGTTSAASRCERRRQTWLAQFERARTPRDIIEIAR